MKERHEGRREDDGGAVTSSLREVEVGDCPNIDSGQREGGEGSSRSQSKGCHCIRREGLH